MPRLRFGKEKHGVGSLYLIKKTGKESCLYSTQSKHTILFRSSVCRLNAFQYSPFLVAGIFNCGAYIKFNIEFDVSFFFIGKSALSFRSWLHKLLRLGSAHGDLADHKVPPKCCRSRCRTQCRWCHRHLPGRK